MADAAGTNVGSVYYTVDLDTSKMVAQQREVEKQVTKVDASLTAVSKATKTHIAALELQGETSRQVAKAQAEAAVANAKVASAADKATASLNRQGLSAKQLAFAQRGLPAQFTDIFTQLAAGQSPMQILIQQGGQIKDTFGGVGAALGAVGRYVLALINPVTIAGAIIGVLTLGFVRGSQESKEFSRAIELSGNSSGVTADRLGKMSAELGNLSNVTRGQAASALQLLVQNGVQGGAALQRYAEAAIRLEQAGGPAVETTAKAFAALGRDPVNASIKLNESTNFLTASLYKQIVALDKQGKVVEAAKLAQDAYATAMLQRAPQVTENLGLIERAARGVVSVAKAMWDAILNIGREQTTDQRLIEVRNQIADLEAEIADRKNQRSFTGAIDATNKREIAEKQTLVDMLKEELRIRERARTAADGQAAADAKRAADTAKAIAASKQTNNFDAVGYIVGLQEKIAEAFAKIDLQEQESLRKNRDRLAAGEINQRTFEQARLLIIAAAGKERADLQLKLDNDAAEKEERFREKLIDIEKREADRKAKGQQLARDVLGGENELVALEQELQAKSALLAEYAARDQENAELYARARASLEQQTLEKMRALRTKEREQEVAAQSQMLSAYGSLFGNLADLAEQSAGRQSGIYQTLFAVSKAFAIADSIMKIQVGIANAAALPYPANLAAMASVVAATSNIVATIQSVSFGGGRQYGGPVTAGSLYRVNETGRPEMFTAANGAQYMLPSSRGRVTSADRVNGGDVVTINDYRTFIVGDVATKRDAQRIAAAGDMETKAAILQSKRRGGAFE